jgi:hypothetical protein
LFGLMICGCWAGTDLEILISGVEVIYHKYLYNI